jgi:hypothetical protein
VPGGSGLLVVDTLALVRHVAAHDDLVLDLETAVCLCRAMCLPAEGRVRLFPGRTSSSRRLLMRATR